MSRSKVSSQYITYLQYRNAVNTVARFLNVPVSEVLPELDRKVRVHWNDYVTDDDTLYSKHRNAIDCVAVCSGLSIGRVLCGLRMRSKNYYKVPSLPRCPEPICPPVSSQRLRAVV